MRKSGFTLVELMIAVAILAIIAAVALPLYNQYSQRTYRSEAQSDLLNCAQGMERYAAREFTYAGAVLADICDPRAAQQNRYNFALENLGADTFTLRASPVGGGVMDGDGDLTVDQAGDRTWNGNPGWEE